MDGMKLDQLRAITDPLERAEKAEEASQRAEEYGRECDRIRDAAMRKAHRGGKGSSYQAIADRVKVSKSTVAAACKVP